MTTPTLFDGFRRSAERYPTRPALEIQGEVWSYEALGRDALSLGGAFAAAGAGDLVGILAARTHTAYRGVLAALATGRGYVPLNPKHPEERLARVVAVSGLRTIVAGREGYPRLATVLAGASEPVTVMLPDEVEIPEFWAAAEFARHRAVLAPEIAAATPATPVEAVAPGTLAYLMFTSGSTGEPKGVAVTHANVRAYARTVADLLEIGPEDRASQMSDLSFDWSVHDLYPCWEGGACLCVVPEKARFAPASFIRQSQVTLWAAVPSSVGMMKSMRFLKPGAFPTIRASVFCGEPLPVAYAAAWQEATPNAILENFYGPTETTVAITRFRWPREGFGDDTGGVVPIGWTFPNQRHRLVGPDDRAVEPGQPGELCFAGDQIAAGYWRRPEESTARFCRLPDTDGTWYRTGDLAREDERGCLHFLGRIDEQVKVRGFRVELQEIDHVVRAAAGIDQVASVAWPVRNGSADGVVAFVAGTPATGPDSILAHCRTRLPDYMVPSQIRSVPEIPLTANGKTDRRGLITLLEQEDARCRKPS